MGQAVNEVQFPSMRDEVVEAVEALADTEYQWSAWVRHELPVGGYDDFNLAIHILFDDTTVAEDPDRTIGVFLRSQEEADAMRKLGRQIRGLFDELGTELSDEEYLRSPGWPAVVAAAKEAREVLRKPLTKPS